jgi:hypothetical protein
MKNSNLAEFTGGLGHPNHQYSFRALSAGDCDELGRFYGELDFGERRRRFGGALSETAVAEFCRAIQWRRTIVIACMSGAPFDAVLEIHQMADGWRRCEIALACRLVGDRAIVIAQLLQLAAFAAGKLGCREFVVPLDESGRTMVPLLASMGRARIEADTAVIDLGDYVGLRGRLASPSGVA